MLLYFKALNPLTLIYWLQSYLIIALSLPIAYSNHLIIITLIIRLLLNRHFICLKHPNLPIIMLMLLLYLLQPFLLLIVNFIVIFWIDQLSFIRGYVCCYLFIFHFVTISYLRFMFHLYFIINLNFINTLMSYIHHIVFANH